MPTGRREEAVEGVLRGLSAGFGATSAAGSEPGSSSPQAGCCVPCQESCGQVTPRRMINRFHAKEILGSGSPCVTRPMHSQERRRAICGLDQ